jgi:hypothetical protein
MRKSSLVGLAGILLVNACSLLFPVPDDSPTADVSDASDASEGSTEPPDARVLEDAGDAAAASIVCPEDARAPKLVPVDTYCIDRTEVTVAQYREFQDAGVSKDAQPPGCEASTYQLRLEPDGGSLPDTPARVDWCDAYAYCRWAGKRLCGSVDGGPLPFNDPQPLLDRHENAWLHACVGPNGTTYPYGNDFEPDACVPGRAVGQPDCQGGYPGIFDLVGNNGEWIDACGSSSCSTFGGTMCRDYATRSSHFQASYSFLSVAGVRCCWP